MTSIFAVLAVQVAAAGIALVAAIASFPIRTDIGGPDRDRLLVFAHFGRQRAARENSRGHHRLRGPRPIWLQRTWGARTAAFVVAPGDVGIREVRGHIPWYGTLYNHASLVIAAVLAGLAYDVWLGWILRADATRYGLLVFIGAILRASSTTA